MLRRPPTVISLTSDDIAAYEDARVARLQDRMAAADEQQQASQNTDSSSSSPEDQQQSPPQPDPSDELKPFPEERPRATRYLSGQSGVSTSTDALVGDSIMAGTATATATATARATAAAPAVATPGGRSNVTTRTGSPQAPARTREQRIGLNR